VLHQVPDEALATLSHDFFVLLAQLLYQLVLLDGREIHAQVPSASPVT